MAVLIVNPNPVFDRTITIPELIPGAVIRTVDVETTAGGKGINVARVLRSLGQPAPLLIPVGREDSPRYRALLAKEGADASIVDVAGPVRTASIYLEQTQPRVTVVNDAGTPMSNADWNTVHDAILSSVAAGDLVLIMGSFPPGLQPDALPTLVTAVRNRGARILLDVNPQWLAASLAAGPDVVTPNVDEAEAALDDSSAHLMDSHNDDPSEVRERATHAALELCARGAQRAIVTAGSSGVAMAIADQVFWVPAFSIDAVSTVGAGDSFVAGFVHEWMSGSIDATNDDESQWRSAVRFGTATSASSCEQVRAGGIDPQRVQQLLNQVAVGATS
jgi:1-phosphofructokinase family hexose kinase